MTCDLCAIDERLPGKSLRESCGNAILRLLRIWMEQVRNDEARGRRTLEPGPGRLSGLRLSFENRIFTRAAAGGAQ